MVVRAISSPLPSSTSSREPWGCRYRAASDTSRGVKRRHSLFWRLPIRLRSVFARVVAGLCLAFGAAAPSAVCATAAPLEGFIEVNGVQLLYLDWGGSGSSLILV